MATRKKEEVEKLSELQQDSQETPKTYNKFAYATFTQNEQHHLIEIPFNSNTLDVGPATILESNEDEFEIQYALEEAISSMMYD